MKKKLILLVPILCLIFTSCEKIANTTNSSVSFTNHWFTDFNGKIDGGEGFDMLKSKIDGKLYVCGAFLHVAENNDMKNFARWDSENNLWEQVPGIDKYHTNFIRCVAEDTNGDLYLGGDFSKIGGVKAFKVGKFSPQAGTWSALRDMNFYDDTQQYGPVGGGVYAIAIAKGYVYVGGGTFTTDSAALRYIRRFNIDSKKWEAVGLGTNGRVKSLATDDQGNIYAGGEFTQAGGQSANYIAKWDGVSWSALGEGTDNYVLAIKTSSINVYVGGSFKNVGGATLSQGIACFNGTTWQAMDMGIYASWGSTYSVQAIAIDTEKKVYIGGFFDSNNRTDTKLNHVAVFENNTWKPLNDGLATSSSQGINGMYADGKDIYFTGYFTKGTGDPNKKVNTAIWNETK